MDLFLARLRTALRLHHRQLVRGDLVWDVTSHPTAESITHQITERFAWNEQHVTGPAIAIGTRHRCETPTTNIGSIRRECTDHIIKLGEAHLRRVLKSSSTYYTAARTHRSPNKDSVSRQVLRAGHIV